MFKKIILFITLLSLLALTACDKKEKNDNNQDIYQDSFGDIANLKLDELSPEDSFSLDDMNIASFTVSDNGEIFAISEDRPLARFSRQGDLLEKYENADSLNNIFYYKNKIFAYNQTMNCIVAYDLAAQNLSKISDRFDIEISRIKDLLVVDDTVYVLFVPIQFFDNNDEIHNFGKADENGFIDYNEKLYSINISDGKMTDLNIDNIINIYKAASGDIFYYAYVDKNYGLYHIDKRTGESKKISDLNDIGYIESFIYEGNNFTYITGNSLYNKDFRNGEINMLEPDLNYAYASKVYLYSGHLIYLEYLTDTADSITSQKSKVTSRYIGDIYVAQDTNNTTSTDTLASENKDITQRSGSLVISTSPYYPVIDLTYFKNYTGIRGRIKEQTYDVLTFLTEIMAGNDNVDIYILPAGDYVTDKLVNMSYYFPLNESNSINDYIKGCFDFISKYSISANGEIWGVPLMANAEGIVYVPENFERYGLSRDDIKYFTNFMKTLERFKDIGDDCRIITGGSEPFFWSMYNQYSFTYNDYDKKQANFKTDLFKSIFTLLDGYHANIGENHPLFYTGNQYYYKDEIGVDHWYGNNPQKVIFKLSSISELIHPRASDRSNYSLGDWRMFPMTRLSEDVKYNDIFVKYAIINPNSKKRDDALFYLDAFVNAPHDALAPYYCNFTQKDIAFYKDEYDTDLPIFTDIYNIIKDGTISRIPAPITSFMFVNDYQYGRLSLDEVIDIIQREYEMALNE